MDRTERFYRIHQLLAARHTAVPMQVFLEELEISLATFKRDLEYLRDRLHAPILWDRERQGYCYDEDDTSHPWLDGSSHGPDDTNLYRVFSSHHFIRRQACKVQGIDSADQSPARR